MADMLERALAALEKTGAVSTTTAFGTSTFKPVVDRELIRSRGFAPVTLNGSKVGYAFYDGYTFDQFIIAPGGGPENVTSLEGLSEVMKPFEGERYQLMAIVPLPQVGVDTTDVSLNRFSSMGFVAARLLPYGYVIEGMGQEEARQGFLSLVDIITDTPYVVTFINLPGLLVIMHDKEAQSLLTAA